MILDIQLNFTLHYDYISNTLSQKIHLFCKLRKMFNVFTALTIYKSHLLSFVEYGSLFMDCLPEVQKSQLQRLLNRCLRVVFRVDRHTSNFELHQRSKLLPLKMRRRSSICILMYKRLELDAGLFAVPGRPGTRSETQRNMVIPSPCTESFKRSISYLGPMLWNTLPMQVKMSNNFATFKRNLKRFLYETFCQDGFV